MYNRKYDKVFIILRSEGEGAPSRRLPGGNCVLEIRNGRVRGALFAQNLRQLSHGRYMVYMIAAGPADAPGVLAGELAVDGRGQGRLRWECSAEDVLGSGQPLERFNTLAVVAEGPESAGMPTAPLCGYTFDRKNWRPYFRRFDETSAVALESRPKENTRAEGLGAVPPEIGPTAPAADPLPGTAPVDTPVVPNSADTRSGALPTGPAPVFPAATGSSGEREMDALAAPSDLSPLVWGLTAPEQPQRDFDQLAARFRQELAALVSAASPQPSPNEESTSEAETTGDTAGPVPEKSDVEASGLWELTRPAAENSTGRDRGNLSRSEPSSVQPQPPVALPAAHLFASHPAFSPFAEAHDGSWIRIESREMGFLPDVEPSLPNQPLVQSCCRRYRHLLLGYNADGVCRLGLPDVYDEMVARQAARLGFAEFWCCEGGQIYPGKYGYWLRTLQNGE